MFENTDVNRIQLLLFKTGKIMRYEKSHQTTIVIIII